MKRIAIILLILITGCTSNMLIPVAEETMKTYTLEDVKVKKHATQNGVLLVDMPKVSTELQSHAILYSKKPYSLEAYRLSRWTTTPASLLNKVMVDGFNKSNAYKSVITTPYTIKPRWRLNTRIGDFHQSFLSSPSEMIISLNIELVDLEKKQVIGKKEFIRRKKAKEDTAYGSVQATNEIIKELIPNIIYFVQQKTR